MPRTLPTAVTSWLALLAVASCAGDPLTIPKGPHEVRPDGPVTFTGTVGGPLPASPRVLVVDGEGAPLEGVNVRWRVTSGGGSVSASYTPTDAEGRASVEWTVGRSIGVNGLRAMVPDVGEGVSFTATGVAGAATRLVKVRGDHQTGAIHDSLPEPFTLVLADDFGNPVVGRVVRWRHLSGGGSLSDSTSVTDSLGSASARLRLGMFSGVHTVEASTPGVPAAIFTATATVRSPRVAVTRAYRQGSRLYLERNDGRDVVRVGLEERWGGGLVELSLNGLNFVNGFDPGRAIQLSVYDGDHRYDDCAGCTGDWGWNPVQGGDRHGAGSVVLESRVGPAELYVKVRPNHWFPGTMGGGEGRAVPADVEIEQWVTPVPAHPRAVRLRYRLTHLGSDRHGSTGQQEFPAMYVNLQFARFVYYGGSSPWTNGAVATATLPRLFAERPPMIYTTEWWGAFVDASDLGVTLFTPGSYPYMTSGVQPGDGGPTGSGTVYTHPYTPFGIGPTEVIEGDLFLIVGDYRESREVVYALQGTVPIRDLAAPIVHFDGVAGNELAGTVALTGWVFDNLTPVSVEVFVDDRSAGKAELGGSRSELARLWPGAPGDAGYRFILDTERYANGPHQLRIRASDLLSNFSDTTLTVNIRNR